MKIELINGLQFICYDFKYGRAMFSTAYNGADYNIHSETGISNIHKLREILDLKNIFYLNQIHSDIIFNTDDIYYLNNKEGDGIITSSHETGIGIFTADCVPVLIYDKTNNMVAAAHSGWKGTLKGITGKAIRIMKNDYNADPDSIEVFIGPHNMGCCYEVSTEIFDLFSSSPLYKNCDNLHDKINYKNLSLQNCIIYDCLKEGVAKIHSVNKCTYCSDDIEFYSYRKNKNTGRQLSMIYLYK